MRVRTWTKSLLISERARLAPRQKCGPRPPNAMCSFGVRSMRNSSGAVEVALVAVGGDVPEDDRVALLDVLAPERGVLGRGPAEVHDRRAVPQHLLGRALHQREVALESLQLVGVPEQRVHAVGGQVPGRLVAGDREQQEEEVDLELGEHVALDLGLGQRGEDVLAGVRRVARRPARGCRRRARSSRSRRRPPPARTPGPRCRSSGSTSRRSASGPPAARPSSRRSPAAAARPRGRSRSRTRLARSRCRRSRSRCGRCTPRARGCSSA